MQMETRWSRTEFEIDLNSVRNGNSVVALLGFDRAQRVPSPGEVVTAIDEDESAYEATVETVLPDSRVYLRVNWASRQRRNKNYQVTFGGPAYDFGEGAVAL